MNPAPRYFIIILTAFFLFLTIRKSWRYSVDSGGCDLRCRIVGSRLSATEYSPYFYKWNPKDGEYYLDPNDKPERFLNGNVVTPAVLYIIYPLAVLPYTIIRPAWTVLQYLFLFFSLFLLVKSDSKAHQSSFWPVIIITAGLVCSEFWLYNIERGQIYIFYTLLFSLSYRLYHLRWKYNHFASGFINGIFVLIRPLTIVMGLGFLLQRKIKWIAGFVGGGIVGCLLFVLPNISLWKDYNKAMQEFINQTFGKGHTVANVTVHEMPVKIEGANNLLVIKNDFKVGRLRSVFEFFDLVRMKTGKNLIYSLFAVAVLILSFLFYKTARHNQLSDLPFLFGFLLYILFELFVPAARGDYNLIQWIFPLFVILRKYPSENLLVALLVSGLLLLHSFPISFYYQMELAEMILICTLLLVIFLRPVKHIIDRITGVQFLNNEG